MELQPLDRLQDFAGAFSRFQLKLQRLGSQQASLEDRLVSSAGQWLEQLTRDLKAKERLLLTLDPKTVLRRGYAIVRREGRAITSVAKLKPGQELEVQLHGGQLQTEIKSIKN